MFGLEFNLASMNLANSCDAIESKYEVSVCPTWVCILAGQPRASSEARRRTLMSPAGGGEPTGPDHSCYPEPLPVNHRLVGNSHSHTPGFIDLHTGHSTFCQYIAGLGVPCLERSHR